MATPGRVYVVVCCVSTHTLNTYVLHRTIITPCIALVPCTQSHCREQSIRPQLTLNKIKCHSFIHKSLLEQVLLATSRDSVNARTLDDDNSWTQVLAEHQRRGTKFTDPDFPPEV